MARPPALKGDGPYGDYDLSDSPVLWGGTASAETLARTYVDTDWYTTTYPDVARAGIEPAEHYANRGRREGRMPNAFFDPHFYREQSSGDVVSGSELEHYASVGWLEGRLPSERFSPAAYLDLNPDVSAAGLEPLAHYVQHGIGEGRAVRPGVVSIAKQPLDLNQPPGLLAVQHLKVLDARGPEHSARRVFNPASLRLDWIIPDFSAGAGGHTAIFKAVYWLSQLGHDITIWLDYPSARADAVSVYEDILRHFVPLNVKVRLLEPKDRIDSDVVVATDRWTVWSALKHARSGAIAYFVQDFEPAFYGLGSDYFLTDDTYNKNLFCICSSPWLRAKMEQRGSRAISFQYPADGEHYYPVDGRRDSQESRRPLIAFYARPATARRAVELGLLALVELAERGMDFTVAMFGQELESHLSWPFPVRAMGVLSEQELGDLFREADVGMALSATNYSISAIEMMACSLAIVDLETEATLATYPDDAVTLAKPTPTAIADALSALLTDDDRRVRQAEAGRHWASQPTWPKIASEIGVALTEHLKSVGHVESSATAVVRERWPEVTVAIPTFNGGARLREVLDAVESQVCPWDYQILAIDSGSTDGSLEELAGRPRVKLHRIPKAEFNHGDTRNLAIELAGGDYVAFLTHDAVPASRTWLLDLVSAVHSVPGVAGAFGRHLPHPGASPFTERDITEHFDLFRRAPLIVNRDTDAQRFADRDPAWLSFLRFFSDNNSCVNVRAWQHLKFPRINFGEDQVWAWNAICAGYSKVYVDRAAVYHSHDYGADETFARARTEEAFFRINFGTPSPVRTEADAQARAHELMGRDVQLAMRLSIPTEVLRSQLSLNAARVAGQLAGSRDEQVVY